MKTVVLDTNLARIEASEKQYELYIRMERGGWVQTHPYSKDARGLIGALTLAIDVLAGKIWLDSVVGRKETERLSIGVTNVQENQEREA